MLAIMGGLNTNDRVDPDSDDDNDIQTVSELKKSSLDTVANTTVAISRLSQPPALLNAGVCKMQSSTTG